MIVRNKWNNALYEFIADDGKTVTLRRTEDTAGGRKGDVLTIAKSDYIFNYTENYS